MSGVFVLYNQLTFVKMAAVIWACLLSDRRVTRMEEKNAEKKERYRVQNPWKRRGIQAMQPGIMTAICKKGLKSQVLESWNNQMTVYCIRPKKWPLWKESFCQNLVCMNRSGFLHLVSGSYVDIQQKSTSKPGRIAASQEEQKKWLETFLLNFRACWDMVRGAKWGKMGSEMWHGEKVERARCWGIQRPDKGKNFWCKKTSIIGLFAMTLYWKKQLDTWTETCLDLSNYVLTQQGTYKQ